MIQRMSDQNKIKFLENSETTKPQNSSRDIEPKKVNETYKSRKLSNKDDGNKSVHSISSANTGIIRNEGGSSKFIKSETSNTIWDSSKLQKLTNSKTSKEEIKKEKEQIKASKEAIKHKMQDEIIENLRNTELSKESTIAPAGNYSGSTYKTPVNGISIFDNDDFERVSEKTEGEIIKESNEEKKSMKDTSWKNGGRVFSSKNIINNLYDNLFKEK